MRQISGPSIGLLLVVGLLLVQLPAEAFTFSKKFAFELDKWYDIGASEGPATVHRLRINRLTGNIKSKIFRPGNSEYLEDVEIEIEYSNDSTRDWDLSVRIHWLDAAGTIIDGYNGKEDMDDESRHDATTIKLSTLRYGLDKARTLRVEFDF
ncbi:MAG: hypothetical protein GY856_31890 [bacterium]|nr:hypothetical protein [bacterium]